jgi:hypothetical protein
MNTSMRSSSCRRIQSIGTNSNEHLGSRRVVPWRWQCGPWQALAAMAAASSGPSPLKERASSIGISNTNTIDCTFSPGFVAILGITRAKREGAARAPALTAKASRSPAPISSSSPASGEVSFGGPGTAMSWSCHLLMLRSEASIGLEGGSISTITRDTEATVSRFDVVFGWSQRSPRKKSVETRETIEATRTGSG